MKNSMTKEAAMKAVLSLPTHLDPKGHKAPPVKLEKEVIRAIKGYMSVDHSNKIKKSFEFSKLLPVLLKLMSGKFYLTKAILDAGFYESMEFKIDALDIAQILDSSNSENLKVVESLSSDANIDNHDSSNSFDCTPTGIKSAESLSSNTVSEPEEVATSLKDRSNTKDSNVGSLLARLIFSNNKKVIGFCSSVIRML